MAKTKRNTLDIPIHWLTGLAKVSLLVACSLNLSGCSAKNKATNTAPSNASALNSANQPYTAENFYKQDNKVTVILAFSGGGTRAAALSYGVLQALRDTDMEIDGQHINLLEEVDMISSVSGGVLRLRITAFMATRYLMTTRTRFFITKCLRILSPFYCHQATGSPMRQEQTKRPIITTRIFLGTARLLICKEKVRLT